MDDSLINYNIRFAPVRNDNIERSKNPELEKKRKEKFYKKMSDPAHLKKLTETNQLNAQKSRKSKHGVGIKSISTPEGVFSSKKEATDHYQQLLGKASPNAGNNFLLYKLKTDKENYFYITSGVE